MSPGAPRSFSDTVRTFGLTGLWCLTAAWMGWDNVRDPYDPALVGTARYGHNWEGALRQGLVITLVELAALHLLLQPWKKGRSWLWVLLTLVLLAPWLMFSLVLCMHSGGITIIHLFWLFLVAMGLVCALAGSAVRALKARRA